MVVPVCPSCGVCGGSMLARSIQTVGGTGGGCGDSLKGSANDGTALGVGTRDSAPCRRLDFDPEIKPPLRASDLAVESVVILSTGGPLVPSPPPFETVVGIRESEVAGSGLPPRCTLFRETFLVFCGTVSAAGKLRLHIPASDGLEGPVDPSEKYYTSLVSYTFS